MRAAKYKRISDDREGERLGVARQDEDLDKLAARLGHTIAPEHDYTDNDIGASTRSRKRRPDYERMLAAARADEFDVILAYTSGRLTRRPRENEDLIELAEQYGVKIQYVASPSFDLNTANGRMVGRMMAAKDANESEEISERVSRTSKQRAKEGRYNGGPPPFGFEGVRELNPAGYNRIVNLVPHPDQEPRVRDAMARVLAGESVYAIGLEWQEVDGKRWHASSIRNILTSPVTAGYRELDGELYEAVWQPIVDRDDWHRLRAILSDPSRAAGNRFANRRAYALSGLVHCAECGKVMVAQTASRPTLGPAFICSKRTAVGACGGSAIRMKHLEPYLFAQFFTRLDSPELHAAMAAQEEDTTDAERALRQAIEKDDRRLVELSDERDDGDITKAEYTRRRDRITKRRDANDAELDKLMRSRAHTRLPDADEVRRVWDSKDETWRRTVLGTVVQRIDVTPHPVNPTTGRKLHSYLAPRRGEDPADHQHRLDMLHAEAMRMRVTVTWWH